MQTHTDLSYSQTQLVESFLCESKVNLVFESPLPVFVVEDFFSFFSRTSAACLAAEAVKKLPEKH